MKKIFIILILSLVLANFLFAKTITIACFQNEKVDKLCKTVTQKFEDSLFEPFFDSGLIVTSIPIVSLNKENTELSTITNLLEEPTDFILIAYMEYEKELKFNPILEKKIPKWKRLKVELIDLTTKKKLYNQNVNLDSIKEDDPVKKAEQISELLALEILTKM